MVHSSYWNLKNGLQHIPPIWPRLFHTVLIQNQYWRWKCASKHAEAHSNPMIVVAEDTILRTFELIRIYTRDLYSIVQLSCKHAELGQFPDHSSDSVTFFDSLVGNADNTGVVAVISLCYSC